MTKPLLFSPNITLRVMPTAQSCRLKWRKSAQQSNSRWNILSSHGWTWSELQVCAAVCSLLVCSACSPKCPETRSFRTTRICCSILLRSKAMPVLASDRPAFTGSYEARRAIAVANARWFRAMAWRVLRDGAPRAQQRAANARAAALIVIRQAKHDALVNRMVCDALTAAL